MQLIGVVATALSDLLTAFADDSPAGERLAVYGLASLIVFAPILIKLLARD
jgi:hypothetical protein